MKIVILKMLKCFVRSFRHMTEFENPIIRSLFLLIWSLLGNWIDLSQLKIQNNGMILSLSCIETIVHNLNDTSCVYITGNLNSNYELFLYKIVKMMKTYNVTHATLSEQSTALFPVIMEVLSKRLQGKFNRTETLSVNNFFLNI